MEAGDRPEDCVDRAVLLSEGALNETDRRVQRWGSDGIAIKCLQKLPHGGDGIEIECARDINELDRAQAPFSNFVFGNERLGFVEARRDVRLRKAAPLAKVTQQLAKLDLAWRAQRVAHSVKPGAN